MLGWMSTAERAVGAEVGGRAGSADGARTVVVILAGFFVLALAVVWAACAVLLPGLAALGVAVVVGAGAASAMWLAGPGLLLHLLRARPAEPSAEPRVHNLLDSLCLSVGVCKPRVMLIDAGAPNVCTIGTARRSIAVVVTKGFAGSLSLVEMEGALARELVQIRRGSVPGRTLVALAVGLPAGILGSAAYRALSNRYGGEERDAVADIEAVSITRYPPGLQSAIMKMSLAACPGDRRSAPSKPVRRAPLGWRATSFLWMLRPVCPFAATHPPTGGTPFLERTEDGDELARNARIRVEVLAEM